MYKKKGKSFVVRTIRNGRVKIGKKWYYPDAKWMEYDGRLDGVRYAFGRYWRRSNRGWKPEPFVYLWGPEHNYHALDSSEWIEDIQIVHGTMPWTWWRTKNNGRYLYYVCNYNDILRLK
jgi:hypothetical protein